MSFLFKLTTIIALLSLLGCSTQKLLKIAIDHERSNANLEVKKINLDFGEIVYLDNNIKSDSAIILLHGFGGDKDVWNRFSAELDGDVRIIVPDIPGHGESVSRKDLGYSITNQSAMLATFLNEIQISNMHIVGNSMGGAIAIKYTGSNPRKVKSLTLIDSLGLKKTQSELDLLIEESNSNPFLNVCTEKAFKAVMAFAMEKPPYIPGIFINDLTSEKCAKAEIENIMYIEMLKDSDMSQTVQNIDVPTLIIWGQKDRVLHVDNAQLFHKEIKNSTLVIFPDLGHVSQLESPEETAKVFDRFINKDEQ